MRRSSLPSSPSTVIERLDNQCTSPSGQTTRNSCATGCCRCVSTYSLLLTVSRSSGWTQAMRSASVIAPGRGARPRRRHICSSHSVLPSFRFISQVPRPTARVASAARSAALRSACSALRRSVMSMTTPYSSDSSVTAAATAPGSRREWLISCRSLPSPRTIRKASSFDSRPLCIQAVKACLIAARSAGCTYCSTHSDKVGARAFVGRPNTA